MRKEKQSITLDDADRQSLAASRGPATGRLRQRRAYLLRNQGSVASWIEEEGEQAPRQELHENALLLGCIAFAIFALWIAPVADARFF